MLQSEIRREANVNDVLRHHDEVKHLVEGWSTHPHPLHTASSFFRDAMRLSEAAEEPVQALALRLRSVAQPHLPAGEMYSHLADLVLYVELITDELGYPYPLIVDSDSLFCNVLEDDETELRNDVIQMYDTLAPMLHCARGFYPSAAWFESLHAETRIIAFKVAQSYDLDPWCAILIASERWYGNHLHDKPLSLMWDTVLKLEFKREEVRS